MQTEKSYWSSVIAMLVLGIGFFMLFKEVFPSKLFPEISKIDEEYIAVDEWMNAAKSDLADSISGDLKDQAAELADPVKSPELQSLESIKSNLEAYVDGGTEVQNLYLEFFYEKLFQLEQNPKSEKVRIAYFGDSMTDADLIVQDVRRKFQGRFGGRGVGFVPIVSETANHRASIIHRFSDNWTTISFMKKESSNSPLGVHGMVFYSEGNAEPNQLRFSAGVNASNQLMPYPVLYYGRSSNDSAEVKMVTKKDTTSYKLSPEKQLNTLKLSSGILSKFELDFLKSDSIPFYGVNFDIPTGVQVDNFSNRGNSGLPLTQLNTNLTRAFQENLKYDLIVLHFGTNVLSSSSFDYSWYRYRMKKVVAHMRKVFPNASILVISIADKATKYETIMQTDSAVNHLLTAQKAFATEEKTGFINLYALMGGEGSMIKWVEEEPQRANADYTHFNPFGAREIGELIYEEIEKGFEEYKLRRDTLGEKDSVKTQKPILKEEIIQSENQDSTDVSIP